MNRNHLNCITSILLFSSSNAFSGSPSTPPGFQIKFSQGNSLSTITGEGGELRIKKNRSSSPTVKKISSKYLKNVQGEISRILKAAGPPEVRPCDQVEITVAMGAESWFGCLDEKDDQGVAKQLSDLSDRLLDP